MSKLATTAAVFVLVCLFAVPAAAGIVHEVNTFYSGTGSLLKSPVIYSGTMSIIAEGTWWFQIDDTSWEDTSDPDARFDFIWDRFFAPNYGSDILGKKWSGYFEAATAVPYGDDPPTFGMDFTSSSGFPYSGHIGGSIRITITVRDSNGNGVLDPGEKAANGSMNADTLHEPGEGTGDFTGLCGFGSLGANDFNFVYPDDDDSIQNGWYVTTKTCESPVEEHSWGAIKALFD
jgi:hypothetical protein